MPERRPESLRTRGVVMCGVAVVLSGLLAGCTGSVEIDSPDVDARDPVGVRAVPRRRAREGLRRAAAPYRAERRARRGLGRPADRGDLRGRDADGVRRVLALRGGDGVGWFIPESAYTEPDEDVSITTIGWSPTVRIDLPPEYRPPADVLVEIGAAVKKALTQTKPCV